MDPQQTADWSRANTGTNVILATILEVTTRVVKDLDHKLVGDSYEDNVLTNASIRHIITKKMRQNVDKLDNK